ncbi:MAG: X-Pro dipeptidyl-peptidase (S15 family), partial [Actinomycetota bacterium]
YVAETGAAADDIPAFQWYDQRGDYYSSNLLPSATGFNGGTVSGNGSGGLLPIVPILGGSGPASGVPFPYNINVGSYARNAINVPVSVGTGQQVAGSPTVSFTYTGLGNARFLYGQFVDNATGRVLGNMTTPVPVTLDGRQHTITMPLANIAYTAPGPSSTLTLQLTSAAVQYASLTSFGLVKVSDVSVALPIVDQANVNP